ncbi:hypothetical protein Tco_1555594 [Tanacetum coccineum]
MLPRMRRPTRSAGPEKLPHHEEEGRVDCTGKRRVVEKTRGGSGDKIHGMVAATKPTTIQSVVLKVGVSTDEVTSIL